MLLTPAKVLSQYFQSPLNLCHRLVVFLKDMNKLKIDAVSQGLPTAPTRTAGGRCRLTGTLKVYLVLVLLPQVVWLLSNPTGITTVCESCSFFAPTCHATSLSLHEANKSTSTTHSDTSAARFEDVKENSNEELLRPRLRVLLAEEPICLSSNQVHSKDSSHSLKTCVVPGKVSDVFFSSSTKKLKDPTDSNATDRSLRLSSLSADCKRDFRPGPGVPVRGGEGDGEGERGVTGEGDGDGERGVTGEGEDWRLWSNGADSAVDGGWYVFLLKSMVSLVFRLPSFYQAWERG